MLRLTVPVAALAHAGPVALFAAAPETPPGRVEQNVAG